MLMFFMQFLSVFAETANSFFRFEPFYGLLLLQLTERPSEIAGNRVKGVLWVVPRCARNPYHPKKFQLTTRAFFIVFSGKSYRHYGVIGERATLLSNKPYVHYGVIGNRATRDDFT